MTFRDFSYYSWENLDIFESNASNNILTSSYYGVALDSSGSIYVVGSYVTSSGNATRWLIRKSTNDGKTWDNVDNYLGPEALTSSDSGTEDAAFGIVIDKNDVVYTVGKHTKTNGSAQGIVRKSSNHGSTWNLIDTNYDRSAVSAIISGSDIYVVGDDGDEYIVRSSSDAGSTWGEYTAGGASGPNAGLFDICLNKDGILCAVGMERSEVDSFYSLAITSSDGGLSWGEVWRHDTEDAADFIVNGIFSVAADSDTDIVYMAGMSASNNTDSYFTILTSSNDPPEIGTFGHSDKSFKLWNAATGISVSPNGSVYACGLSSSEPTDWDAKGFKPTPFAVGNPISFIRRSLDRGITWNTFGEMEGAYFDIFVTGSKTTGEDVLYLVGQSNGFAILKRATFTSNSASIGPRMLSPSVGYAHGELSTSVGSVFKLNNLSEFPHSNGIYQMSNIVLGTKDSGKIGKDDESIIQVRQFGSIVKVLWPKQDGDNFTVGYGDFSQGTKPGKLTTDWIPGEWISVDKYDHLSLYSYLTKELSGTLDSILIRVERKPLVSIGPTIDQAVSYESSGSYYVEEVYKDLIKRKDIDYGDTSIKEIAWPSDIPLVNVKQVRISARQKNGQTNDKNTNLIIYGRLINSEEET